mgnify:CR=1 FL=1
MSNIKVIRPQKGPQEKFLSTTADIATVEPQEAESHTDC